MNENEQARLEAENRVLRETIRQLNQTINRLIERYIVDEALPE